MPARVRPTAIEQTPPLEPGVSRVCGTGYRARRSPLCAPCWCCCLLWLSLFGLCVPTPQGPARAQCSASSTRVCKCKPYLNGKSGDVGCGSLCADQWPRSTSQTTVVGTTYLNRGLWTGKCKPVSKCKLSNHRQQLGKWPYDYTYSMEKHKTTGFTYENRTR